MSNSFKVSVTAFRRNFARYQKESAAGNIIEVTKRGHLIGGYLSCRELEHYRLLKEREPQALIVGELEESVIYDIEHAELGVFDPSREDPS